MKSNQKLNILNNQSWSEARTHNMGFCSTGTEQPSAVNRYCTALDQLTKYIDG
jgi:hypothetical protein